MRAYYILATTLLLFGHSIKCYSQIQVRNFLAGEIDQGMRTTTTPRPTPIPHNIPSPASALWSVLNERESPDFADLSKEESIYDSVLDKNDLGLYDEKPSKEDLDLYNDLTSEALYDDDNAYEDSKIGTEDSSSELPNELGDQDEGLDGQKVEDKRYFSSLGGSYIHGKRNGFAFKRYLDSLGGNHVFKRSSDYFGDNPDEDKRAPLDSLGGWQIHGYKRQFDTLGGTNLHNDFKRFVSTLGGGNIHAFKRGFGTLGGTNLHSGYKRFMSSLGGGNVHSGFKRRFGTLGGANLHSGYKRYFSSLGGSNIHSYKRGLSALGGANVHSGYKRQADQYGDDDLFVESETPEKRQLDPLGGFNVHRYKRSRISRPDSEQAAAKIE